jgi:hypothetical protein
MTRVRCGTIIESSRSLACDTREVGQTAGTTASPPRRKFRVFPRCAACCYRTGTAECQPGAVGVTDISRCCRGTVRALVVIPGKGLFCCRARLRCLITLQLVMRRAAVRAFALAADRPQLQEPPSETGVDDSPPTAGRASLDLPSPPGFGPLTGWWRRRTEMGTRRGGATADPGGWRRMYI